MMIGGCLNVAVMADIQLKPSLVQHLICLNFPLAW